MVVAVMCFAASANAVNLGQTDDFQDGTTQGWTNGGAGAPAVTNVTSGGPAGAGDNFIQITSIGGGNIPGGRLTAFNRAQWLGNYIANGMTAIEMDLRNTGSVTLSIRLAFRSSGTSGYLSAPVILAAGDGWQHVVFSLNPSTLTPIGSPGAYIAFFSTGISEIRLINEAGATDLIGDVVAAQLGVDNVRAVPEPGAIPLLVIAFAAGFTFLVRRRP